jgi:NitT/TauT family transport system substrate-binding protein
MRRCTRANALALGAAAVAAPTFVRAQTTTTLRVGGAANDTYMEARYGVESGIFAKHGFTLEITDLPNAAAIVAAVAGNSLDLGMCDMIQLAAPSERGLPFAYFAGGCLYRTEAPTTLLCVARNSNVQSAKDLEGKTVAVVALNSLSSVAVTEWLRRNGADLTKIQIFEAPFSTMAPGLARGTVAAAFIGEPFVSSARADVRVLASAFDVIAKQFYIGAWFAPRDWLSKNAEMAKRFAVAVYETARWSNTHRDDTAAVLTKVSRIDAERVRAMARASFATSIDTRLMQPVIDLAVRYNLLAKRVDANDLIVRV